ncbi:S-crystallin [Parasponia andersonii]|uniref:glutathione transferase n=1 Tax=Parasponia andersonii TaxID=3476 RepID=A0A2P5APK6_PARAD|nr:S-crystallin [Parasponia andersonii]
MATGSDEHQPKLKLYSYWRSSCSWRVRIALNFKGLKYEYIPVNIMKGEQHNPEFLKLNPIGYVPVLVDGDLVLSDSLAILLYLDEKYPQRPLLPTDLKGKAINLQQLNLLLDRYEKHENSSLKSSLGNASM